MAPMAIMGLESDAMGEQEILSRKRINVRDGREHELEDTENKGRDLGAAY